MTKRKRSGRIAALAAAILWATLLLSACGGGGDKTPPAPQEPLPTRPALSLDRYDTIGLATYKSKYTNTPFFADGEDSVTYVCNAMWDKFGVADDGTAAVPRLGNNSAWLYWDAVKSMWHASSMYAAAEDNLADWPITRAGYVWSWQDSEYWGGKGYNDDDPTYTKVYHMDNNFNYVNAVYETAAWSNGTAFLSRTDEDEIEDAAFDDASRGKTVLQKTEAAMTYILETLHGKDGLIVIDDGRATGERNSSSANYWDNLCFGYKDAYEGMLFLGSLRSMAGIYRLLGREADAAKYAALYDTAHAAYDRTYWDETKGRYVSTISASGEVFDLGLTFLNTEALYYGAGDAQKAAKIFDWIDGKRIVEGDTVTGLAVLDTWHIAAVSNTLSVESTKKLNEQKRYDAWWHGPSSINPFSTAAYGEHCENGGAIFYTAFFENMARLRYGGEQDVLQRLLTIAAEYGKDELMRDPRNKRGTPWVLGVIGEFPESGLVPALYVRGLLGVNADAEGLSIMPHIPSEYRRMGSKQLRYGSLRFTLTVDCGEAVTLRIEEGVEDVSLTFADIKGADSYTATVTADGGVRASSAAQKLADGNYRVRLHLQSGDTVRIA